MFYFGSIELREVNNFLEDTQPVSPRHMSQTKICLLDPKFMLLTITYPILPFHLSSSSSFIKVTQYLMLNWNGIRITFLFFWIFAFAFLSLFFFFFYFTILYWFCHTSTWIRHGYTRVPHPEIPSHIPPRTIPLGHPSAPAPSIQYHASNLDWQFVSYMILYMFHPTLALSHRVQKTVLYICVSFAVSYTGLSLPSF